jgi:DNA-binding NtrC family response regulator
MNRPSLDAFLYHAARAYLSELMAATGGNVREAAAIAGRNRSEMYRVLRRHGLLVGQMRPSLELLSSKETPDSPVANA